MRSESAFSKIIQLLFDSIEEIVSIGIAAQLIYLEIATPTALDAVDLIPRILAIVTLLAVSSLRDKLFRIRRISKNVDNLQKALEEKVFDPIRAENLFREGVDPALEFLENAEQIFISGITLVRTIGKFHESLSNQVVRGADVRIILVDRSKKDAISQLELRSWGPIREGYYENRLASTISQIEIIGENIRATSNALGSLELGVLPFVPSFGLIMIDPGDHRMGKVWIEIYHHRTDNPGPRFLLHKYRDPNWFDFFSEQFEEMWSLCDIRKIV